MYLGNIRDVPRLSGPSVDCFVYKVQFKRDQRYFVISKSAPKDIEVGDFVKVEADRGEDLGVVCSKIWDDEFRKSKSIAGFRSRGSSSMREKNKLILGRATKEEKAMLITKLSEEKSAVKVCHDKVKRRQYPMVIRDAEYQFDRHKLTFFYEADHRIDFRELVSDLFTLYKTRIW